MTEDFYKNVSSKSALTDQIFKLFTDACGGSAVDFADETYARYAVDDYAFHDDFQYWNVHEYFKEKVIPHKIAVYQSGLQLSREPWFKDFYINKEAFLRQLWRHDMSKFSANESLGYSFYKFGAENGPNTKAAFESAWNHHKNHNEHHPEYWMNVSREGKVELLPMPKEYVAEMIADWMGAGKTYGSTLEEWLPKNLTKFLWHKDTCFTVFQMLTKMGYNVGAPDDENPNVLHVL